MADRLAADGLAEAWEAGFSIVAAALNAAMPRGVPKIKAAAPTAGSTLRASRDHFLDCLIEIPSSELTRWPALRRAKRDASGLKLWTVGHANGHANPVVMLASGVFDDEDESLQTIACLLRNSRDAVSWKTEIIKSLLQHAAEWRGIFASLRPVRGKRGRPATMMAVAKFVKRERRQNPDKTWKDIFVDWKAAHPDDVVVNVEQVRSAYRQHYGDKSKKAANR